MENAHDLQVMIVAGPEDPRRAILGLSMAASAASTGAKVNLYLVMGGARFLLKENCSRILVEGYPSVAELVEVVHDSGGTVGYCPNCLDSQCTPALPGLTEVKSFCHLAHPRGMSTFGMRMTTIPTVVF
ncbi:MAG: DsrE family protein [Bryobacterales bacterium]|nr:DsrE family protein [Bryobacterales bacterium]